MADEMPDFCWNGQKSPRAAPYRPVEILRDTFPGMSVRTRCAGTLLTGALLLPGPGTTSRERDFCREWLSLESPARQSVLIVAETNEADAPWDLSCRTGLRSGLRHLLDTECRNWRQLMDFEVRALVDRVLEPCVVAPPEPKTEPKTPPADD